MNKIDEKAVVKDYLSGNRDKAANIIMNTYRNFVYTTTLRYLNDHYEADDATQEIFIKIFKNINKFKFKSSLKTWVYQIARNHCYSELRKNKNYQFTSTGNMEDNEIDKWFKNTETPLSKVESEEFFDAFHTALNKLPEKQRETFALRYFEELTYEEISNILDTSVGGLKANYYHAVKKLSQLIDRN